MTMSGRMHYGTEPILPPRRAAISQAIEEVVCRLQMAKNYIEKPKPLMFADLDEMLRQLEAARRAMAQVQHLLQ